MNVAGAGLAIATPLALLATLAGGGPWPGDAPPWSADATPWSVDATRPVDRWLVSDPFAADQQTAPLSRDLLDAPGEPGVLPDRGLPAAGVTWSLVRRDGEASVPLDSLLTEIDPGTVVYAHSYIRLPADRTLRLTWGGEDCTAARAWLNGREIAARQASARFGAGWNTLLLKLVAGDCPFGYSASLASVDEPGDQPANPALDGIRVQASRPPGDVRTGPDDWVMASDTARVAPDLRWKGDRLYAGLVVGLTGWGRAPIADVEVELQGGPNGRDTAPWLVPGTPGEVVVPVRLDRLPDLVAAGVVDARVRWGKQARGLRLRVAGDPPGDSDRVVLEGWEVARSGARSASRGGSLPNAAGRVLEGEWKVPERLAGRTLSLDVSESPGEYSLNGSPAASGGASVALCAPCSRGVRLQLRASSTGAWTAFPAVRVRGAGAAR